MTASSRQAAPLPDLVLYGRPGCHLCDETRALLERLLDRRVEEGLPAPALVERDITTSPEWERDHGETIPVVEIGERQLPLAVRPALVVAFVEAALREAAGQAGSPAASPSIMPPVPLAPDA